jgi:hypothetical protein
MIEFLTKELNKLVKTMKLAIGLDEYKNIYIQKGKADVYPCLVAHTDTVHDIRKGFKVMDVDGVFFAWDNVKHEQAGVGGDDKVGIYMCLQALVDLPAVKVVFFRNEEVGCLGSKEAHMPFFEDVAFVLQADRKGSSDFINYSNGVDLFDKEFKDAATPILDKYGYKICNGISTDVGQLKKNKLPVACANVSCGYYEAHTSREYVIQSEVENCYNLFIDLFAQLGDQRWLHELRVSTPTYHNTGHSYGYNSYGNNQYRGKKWGEHSSYKNLEHRVIGGKDYYIGESGYWVDHEYHSFTTHDDPREQSSSTRSKKEVIDGEVYEFSQFGYWKGSKFYLFSEHPDPRKRKDYNPMNESDDLGFKKKESTVKETTTGTISKSSEGPEDFDEWEMQQAQTSELRADRYRLCKERQELGYRLQAVCPRCDHNSDFWDNMYGEVMCDVCYETVNIKDIDSYVDYKEEVDQYEKLYGEPVPEEYKSNYWCSCRKTCLPKGTFYRECITCTGEVNT